MAHKVKVSRKKEKALRKRLLSKTLTDDDYELLIEIVKESIESGSSPRRPMTDLAFDKGRELLGRLLSKVIVEDDYGLLAQIVASHMFVCAALKEKNATIRKLQHMLFGAATEKASKIIPELKKMTHPKKDERSRGHGRNGASSYTGGTKVTISHTSFKKGDLCPECQKGKIYPTDAGLTVRISGSAPLQATSFECEKLRCNLCGEVFTAAPDEGPAKYDATSGAMIALMR